VSAGQVPCGFDEAAHARPTPRGPGRIFPERESLELLAAAGIPVVRSVAVDGRRASAMLPRAIAAAEQVGWPVAVKLDAPGLAHKSDIGAVELDIANPTQLGAALRRVLAAGREHEPDGVLIQPMARRNVELIVGARRDAQFGPLVMVGLGGVLAEVIDDVVLGLAPLRPDDALEMLASLRHVTVLDGIRGRRPVNRPAIAAVMVALADAMLANPEWLEVDLNPVIASSTGAVAVDALIAAEVRGSGWDGEDSGGRPTRA
jgi:hypothetical protein